VLISGPTSRFFSHPDCYSQMNFGEKMVASLSRSNEHHSTSTRNHIIDNEIGLLCVVNRNIEYDLLLDAGKKQGAANQCPKV
jgi:hypothetical protein